MALTTIYKIFELDDAKIAPMTADTGESPTYGTSVDLPGVVKIGVSPKMENKKLYGDNVLLDIWSKVTEVEVEVEMSKIDLNVIKTVISGTVTASGTTPNQKQTFQLKGSDSAPGYFKLEGRWVYAESGVGDVHLVLYKIKATDPPSFEVEGSEGNFGKCKFKGVAIPCASNSHWFDIVGNETAVAIS